MPAYVHIDLPDQGFGPASRTGAALSCSAPGRRRPHPPLRARGPDAGRGRGSITHGFESAALADALAFYQSAEYAPIKVERDAAQEARVFVVDAGRGKPDMHSAVSQPTKAMES
jgi:hypothetical protein